MTKALFTIAALVLCAAEIRPVAAAVQTLPTGTFISGGTTINVDIAAVPGSGVHPTIIFLYGEDGETSLFPWNYPYIASWFASQGFNCFIVHYLNKSFPYPTVTAFSAFLQVINDGTTWVMSQPGVNTAKIAIMGMSLGASLGVSASARDLRVKALAAWYGAEATWYEYLTRNTITHMPPTIMLHGANDPVSPLTNVYALQTLLQGLNVPSQVYIYPNEGHAFNATDQQQGLVQTLAYLTSYLGG